MYISLQWINEVINIKDIQLSKLIETLTLGGFEIEDKLEITLENKKTITFDITTTPNRSESLSIKGISKEILTLYDITKCKSKYIINQTNWKLKILKYSNQNKNNLNYSNFFGFTIENLNTLNSPKWLKKKLIFSGLTPFDNLLDFKNYILLETGYPIEFYDLNKIFFKLKKKSFNLNIKNNNYSKLRKLSGENGQLYKLNKNVSLIKANNLILGITGVLVNQDFSYTDKTNSLLIENAVFKPTLIRKQLKNLALKTSRSKRYEKDLNSYYLLESSYHLLNLLNSCNKNLICKLHTASHSIHKVHQTIYVKYTHIIEVLGPITNSSHLTTYLTPIQINTYFNKLNFFSKFDKKKSQWEIIISELRSKDIKREIDLIEEIGRLHGYNNFKNQLPLIKQIGLEDLSYKLRKKIILILLNSGLNEITTYSLRKFQSEKTNKIKLINPLIDDYSMLRDSLLPSLLKIISNNIKQGNLILEVFEFSHIFNYVNAFQYQERENISGIFGGIYLRSTWSQEIQSLSWYESKGKIEHIFKKLHISIYWKKGVLSKYKTLYHPYQTAIIYNQQGQLIGQFGQIHPNLCTVLNVNKNLFLFEFDFINILLSLKNQKLPIYQKYSYYPKIIKDISFFIHKKFSFLQIKNVIQKIYLPYLIKIKLLDTYKGDDIPYSHIGVCIQLIFQSKKNTLTKRNIEKFIIKIKIELMLHYNIILR